MAAPLAHFDEDWQDFNEFQSGTDSVDRLDLLNSNVDGASPGPPEDLSDLDSGFSGELCSFRSMEDLVHDFDDKLTVCFRNYRTKTDNIAPVRPITEDSFLKDDEVWNALTDNYGNVMPVDWKTSHTRCLHLPTLHLSQQDHQCLDVSDDEDLREQMDYHSIITSCLSEPLYTAEQVIEEIEEMMQESPDPDGEESSSRSDPSQRARSRSIASLEDRLRGLSVRELSEELEEVEAAVRRRGEELIEALALRDEEEEEKEVKNSFIQLLMQLQQRQKEHRDALRRSNNRRVARPAAAARTHTPGTLFTMVGLSSVIQNGLRQPFSSTGREKQYLTTVIPYEKKRGSPSVEDLQILTKILRAMRDDSEKVPSLLTDYILKALV